jgi:ribosomal protein S18 acetylase RimI-like enzyme
MSIRKASKEDIREIQKHARRVFLESTMGLLGNGWENAKQIKSVFLSNGGYYLIWNENDRILGWIGIGIIVDPFTDEEIGIINELYVLPPYRHRGIARELCYEAMVHFKKHTCKKVQLNVFQGNKARELYRNLGFKNLYTTMEKKLE